MAGRHARQSALTTTPPPQRKDSCCLQLNLCHLDRTFPKPLTGCVKALMYHMPVSHGSNAVRLQASDFASTSRHLHLDIATKAHRATEPPPCCCRALMLSCACGWQSGSVSMSAMGISTGPGAAGPMWQTSPATIPAGGATLDMSSASALVPFQHLSQLQNAACRRHWTAQPC